MYLVSTLRGFKSFTVLAMANSKEKSYTNPILTELAIVVNDK
jgi:hypothetical protein